jgi:hypothetical protein
MKILTDRADLRCDHGPGKVDIEASQKLVMINDLPVLVKPDPENRKITGCPMTGAFIKPCTNTFAVKTGYSDLLKIDNQQVCLDTVTGLTNGTPPGGVYYKVLDPGQKWVNEG